MACFVVPAIEAVVSTIVTKAMESKEKKDIIKAGDNKELVDTITNSRGHVLLHKMKWLNSMLWGGSALLAFEHVWHGEVVPFFPFLTAASDPKDALQMIHEMGTVGVAMAAVVTVVWGGMVAVSRYLETHAVKQTRTMSEQHR